MVKAHFTSEILLVVILILILAQHLHLLAFKNYYKKFQHVQKQNNIMNLYVSFAQLQSLPIHG